MKRLAIITTHPIQYYAPVFQLISRRQRIAVKVFYTAGQPQSTAYDKGFGRDISWDIPLTSGYEMAWIANTAAQPGTHHFKGIINPQLIADVEAYRPDAVLVFGWAYHSHLKALRYFKVRIPVLFKGDSTLLDDGKNLKSALRTLLLKWVYRYIDTALYNGINNKAYFEKFGLTDQQLCFAPHAVDNDRFGQNRKDEADSLRSSLGIGTQDVVILFSGKFEPKKNPLLLLEAFERIDNNHCFLLFVGNGVLEQAIKQRAGHHKRVRVMDFQNQSYMPVVYQACDLFCLPSQGPGETWGLAVNEAMACGKAVVVSDKTGCAPNLVKDGYNGFVFESNNPAQLTGILQQLCASKNTLNNYGQHSLELIKFWNFTRVAQAVEDIVLR